MNTRTSIGLAALALLVGCGLGGFNLGLAHKDKDGSETTLGLKGEGKQEVACPSCGNTFRVSDAACDVLKAEILAGMEDEIQERIRALTEADNSEDE